MASPPSPGGVPCPICEATSDSFGTVDFHKSCLEAEGRQLNPSGLAVEYRRCPGCGFVFCETFRTWTPEQFKAAIYNQDYIIVDPDYVEARPMASAIAVDNALDAMKDRITLLDYGGGNGRFAEIMRGWGYAAQTYDPFSDHRHRPTEKVDYVTAFEVMEHTNTPHETVRDMASFMKDDGFIIFTTLLQPDDFDQVGLNWPYIAPRNGHISIFSKTALTRLFNQNGLNVRTLSEDSHIAYRAGGVIPP